MNEKNSITALVPMKDFSERVQGKNARNFNGRPLCQYILETLQHTSTISRIIVNTDSRKLAKLASDFSKVIVHARPDYLIGNDVPMNDIIAYDLESDQDKTITNCHYLQTHVTNPLITSQTIEQAIINYFNNIEKYDALFTVTPYQARFYFKNGNPINHNPNILENTQNLPIILEENSCIYIFSKESFLKSGKRIGTNPYMMPISRIEAQDIDTEEDFLIAEYLYRSISGENAKL